ncbi:MAG: hypothetical protein KGR19_08720, partial [Acidobacteria bacterium]|nr:hypothetical protein [Acidobacteriota bacterium]
MPAEHVLLIARYDVLATAEPGDALPQVTGFARLSDPEADVSAWAARARAAAPDAAILIDSTPEEKSALAEAGIPTIDWPERWLPVSDYLYRDPAQIAAGTGVFFFGATNDRRDRFL